MKNINAIDKWLSLDMAIQEHGLEAVMKDPYWETCCNSDEYIERRRAYLDAQKLLRHYISSELNEDAPTKLEKNTDKKEDSVTEAEIALWDEVFKLSVAERGQFIAREHADAAIKYRREKFGSR